MLPSASTSVGSCADSPGRLTGSVLCTPDVAVSTARASVHLPEVTKTHCHYPIPFDFGIVSSLKELAGSGFWFSPYVQYFRFFLPIATFLHLLT